MNPSVFLILAFSSFASAQFLEETVAPRSDSENVVRLQALARVGGSTVTTRNLYIFHCVKKSKACNAYRGFVNQDYGTSLQEYLLVKMAFEENLLFRTVVFSAADVDGELEIFRKKHKSSWQKLVGQVQMQESEARAVLKEIMIFEEMFQSQESLENWISQLKSRYKVQMFNQNAS